MWWPAAQARSPTLSAPAPLGASRPPSPRKSPGPTEVLSTPKPLRHTPASGPAPALVPVLLTLQVVSAALRRETPRPRCPVPHRGRVECPRLRSFGDSAFRHGCSREGGGRRVMPPSLTNNSAAGSFQHPGATATATSGATTSPETTSAPRAATLG